MRFNLVKSINNKFFINDLVQVSIFIEVSQLRKTYTGRIIDITDSYLMLDISEKYNSRTENVALVYINNIEEIKD